MAEKRDNIGIVTLPEYAQADPGFVVSGLCELGNSFFDQIGVPHRHDFYTIYWIKRGKLLHTIDATTYEVKKNTLFFIAPGQVHNLQASDKIEGYMIAFRDAFMCLKDQTQVSGINSGLFFNNQFSSIIHLNDEQEKDIEAVVRLMMKELTTREPEYEMALHGLLRYFLVLASRIKGENVAISPDQHAAHNSSIFLKFKNLIEEKYTILKTVSDYAALLHIKPVLLNEISKQLSGITAGEHIRNRVILEAQRYLYNTDLTAKEIAYKLGFDDPHYFSRFFKKYTNQSPSEFKDASRTSVSPFAS
ncbi:AraC-type DNA-binding protein [Chitinophaga terrae (ex Kim and Jung 2007)]|uniref:AraC-type DNA-binding protein n=1 Tax=Chitinophaga terrae (ex Kim and Jung 2007) TaxID=408074 RepID=A0A1H4CNA4_9BACT|nr:helix-turn-helix domain-containing protein [Chitinophaga terrae (ex Kim and Jung 2007)]GEP90343.1 AraC family transcriptional regulator [Chitinophaga terrae (ex Kim and Jung 2007)]SEA61807.1 AraC-type DNA-binding protein [Chitinophaga terrae (ex Kim and Jung 2007)]